MKKSNWKLAAGVALSSCIPVGTLYAQAAVGNQSAAPVTPAGGAASESTVAQNAVSPVTASAVAGPSKDELAAQRAAAKTELAAQKVAAKEEQRKQRELKRLYGEGPYPDEVEAFLQNRPEPLKPLLNTLIRGGERNSVLNLNRAGLAAMELGEWAIAEKAFDLSLTRIEAVYSKSVAAEQAKSSFKKEARKDYKGEPYERAMAYYYRGLLYLRANDFDNARASFNGALYQDSINLDGDRGQDFASMNYLAGWASKCAKDQAVAIEQFEQAAKTKPDLKAPVSAANTIIIAELGKGPAKTKGGANGELLEFVSNTGTSESVVEFSGLASESKPVALVEAASLSYQAAEREGRKMDGVLKGKADTKTALNSASQALMSNALSQSSNPYGNPTGAMAGMIGGLALGLFGSAVRADADIRQWDSLPERIMLGTGKYTLGAKQPVVTFKNGSETLDIKPAAFFVAKGPVCSMMWTRSRSSIDVVPETPGDDLGVAKASASRKDVQLKDKAFRQSLLAL